MEDDDARTEAIALASLAAKSRLFGNQELAERLRTNGLSENTTHALLARAAEWHSEFSEIFESSPGAEQKQHDRIADAADNLARLLESVPYREYLQTGDATIDDRTMTSGVPLDEYLRKFAAFLRKGYIVENRWFGADDYLTESGRKTNPRTACIRWLADLVAGFASVGFTKQRLPDRNVIVAMLVADVLGLEGAERPTSNDIAQALKDVRRKYLKDSEQ